MYMRIQHIVIFWPSTRPKMLFQGDTPEGSDTFQWPVIERDREGRLRLIIWDKVKAPLCHYSDAPEESNLCMTVVSAWWRLNIRFRGSSGDRVGVELLYNWVELGAKAIASRIPDSQRPDVVGKATPDREALGKPRWSRPQHQENKKDTTWRS